MHVHKTDSSLLALELNSSVRDAELTGMSQSGRAGLQRLGYSVAEAAQIISISKSKLWELIRSRKLGSVKISGRRIVRHSDLVALLNGETI
jgi:excisionase family DNA binding protein